MKFRVSCVLFSLVFAAWLAAQSQTPPPNRNPQSSGPSQSQPFIAKLPAGVILIKGASASASDSVTPVPEGATVTQSRFSSPYFGIDYALPPGFTQEDEGPPPSESGRYVLAQLGPPNAGPDSASMLITAQDMFFTPLPAANALELTGYIKDHLQNYYQAETAPTLTTLAGHAFSFFAYWSPAAELHWYVLAIQVRCHALQFVLTSRDPKLLDHLISNLNQMKLPPGVSVTAGDGGGSVPVCVQDYARDENVIARVDPIFAGHRFNPVPVRIIIDRDGKVKHIHVLSAFPDQAQAIRDALTQWKFKPYRRGGQPVEVETGILFGRAPHLPALRSAGSATE